MKRLCFLLLSTLFLASCNSPEPDGTPKGTGDSSVSEVTAPLTPVEQFTKLNDEFAEASRSDSNDLSGYSQKFLDLAKKHPEDRIAFGALNWVVVMSKDPQQKAEAIDELLAAHMDEVAIQTVCEVLQKQPFSERSKAQLEMIMEKSPHESVRGIATYSLAAHLASAPAGERDDQEIEDLYQTVVDQYGSNPQLMGRAKSALSQMKLAIGKVAPEIIGKDLDGEEFKLSDYRGKVVVLDFWGDW